MSDDHKPWITGFVVVTILVCICMATFVLGSN